MTIDLKPCCCGCQSFLPPWALREEWTGGEIDPDDTCVSICCVHECVCGRWAETESEGAAR